MDDEKAVGMTTDAKPLPLSPSDYAERRGLEASEAVTDARIRLIDDLRATIAQQAEQIERRTKLIHECAKTTCEGYCGSDLGMVSGVDCYGCEIIAALNQRGDNE